MLSWIAKCYNYILKAWTTKIRRWKQRSLNMLLCKILCFFLSCTSTSLMIYTSLHLFSSFVCRTKYGRQVYVYPPGGCDRPDGSDRLLRAMREGGAQRDWQRPGQGGSGRQPGQRSLHLYVGDAGDSRHSAVRWDARELDQTRADKRAFSHRPCSFPLQLGHGELAHHYRRARQRHVHVRRLRSGLGHQRTHRLQNRLLLPVCHTLPWADGAGGAAAYRPQPARHSADLPQHTDHAVQSQTRSDRGGTGIVMGLWFLVTMNDHFYDYFYPIIFWINWLVVWEILINTSPFSDIL